MARKEKKWYKLDNAAKIIPSTAMGSDTRVFRLCCELKEEVDPEVLQAALDRAVMVYPHFRCHLKRGLFWYYLEQSPLEPRVTEENLPALSALYHPGRRTLLFRVNYFRRRINLEMYHVLADGTGGFWFFREILRNYMILKYGLELPPDENETASSQDMQVDAFRHFYEKKKKNWILSQIFSAKKPAYQMRGTRDENMNVHLLEGIVSVRQYLDICHAYGTTIAIMTTALMIESVLRVMDASDKKKQIVITVPVNLRNYYPSKTTRNFFGVIGICFQPEDYDGTLESIISVVKKSYAEQLEPDRIAKTMNSYSALERNWAVKVLPLQVKNIGIQGFNYLRLQEVTTSVSNVGRLTVPEPMEPYIDHFAGFMSTRRGQMVVVSFGDKLVFGITSAFKQHDVMMHFFRRLSELGLEVELAANDYDLEESAGKPAGVKKAKKTKKEKKAKKSKKR